MTTQRKAAQRSSEDSMTYDRFDSQLYPSDARQKVSANKHVTI
jgi:hypothetical protein